MAELSADVVEQILVRLDVKDLIRFKSVCKPWYFLISSPRFVKAHLKRSYENDRDNPELGNRRIHMIMNRVYDDSLLYPSLVHVVGSSNGLVCVSHRDAELFVTNPLTRELKILQTPPFVETGFQEKICWGFGFDSSTDDYKVIAGFGEQEHHHMVFYVLTLKSNVWRLIGEVKYRCVFDAKGILCGGALYWLLGEGKKRVIVSVDLSTEEFKEIPQPTDGEYERYKQIGEYGYVFFRLPTLGVFEECLCYRPLGFLEKWIMKNNKWEHHDDHTESKYDIAHDLALFNSQISVYAHDDGVRVPSGGGYNHASIFVKSLVSPHPYDGRQKRRIAMCRDAKESVESSSIRERNKNIN